MAGALSFHALAARFALGSILVALSAPQGHAEFADNRSLMFIFDQCADSHPSFDTIAQSANAYGFDSSELAPGHIRYNNPVEHPNSFLEVKSLENGSSHCIAYNANVPVSKAIADFNLLVLPHLKFGTPIETAVENSALAYQFSGMLYDLWVYISPLQGGGSAMIVQVANADQNTADSLTLNGQEINWRPSGGVPSSDFRIAFGFFCMGAIPNFENSVPAMRNTGAVVQPIGNGQSVSWPGASVSFYLESATASTPGQCQISSPDVSLAEINGIGRTQLSDLGNEEDQSDGTRVWRFPDARFGNPGALAYSFTIPGSDTHGLAIQMNDIDRDQ